MSPTELAAKLCAALIEEGLFKEDGGRHHRIHAVAVSVFEECEREAEKAKGSESAKHAAALSYRYGEV